MTVVDDARASMERLIVDRQAQIERGDGLQSDLDRALSLNAGLRADLDRVQAEFDAYKASHPDGDGGDPEPTTTLIGATVGGSDGGLNVVADVRRCYDLSGSGAREASQRCRVGGVVWANYKGAISDSALRSELQGLTGIVEARHQTALVTYEHEPDIKGGIPTDVYHRGYDQLERIIVDFPLLEPIVCLTGFTGDKDPSIWERYSRPGHRKIGADHFNKGHQTQGEPFATPAENFGKLVAFAKSKGKPLCIAETGVGTDAVPGPVIKTRADWYRAHRAYALDPANNFFAMSAFDSGLGRLDAASAQAWYGLT